MLMLLLISHFHARAKRLQGIVSAVCPSVKCCCKIDICQRTIIQVAPSRSPEPPAFWVGFSSFSCYRKTPNEGVKWEGVPKSSRVFCPKDGLCDRITWKRLKIDARILQGILQALNFLISYPPFTAIPRTAYPQAGQNPQNSPSFSRRTGFPIK